VQVRIVKFPGDFYVEVGIVYSIITGGRRKRITTYYFIRPNIPFEFSES
jgi:hypothetical protein